MSAENPTPGNEGASIEARLEKFLSAEESPPEQPKEAPKAQAEQAPEPAEDKAPEVPENGAQEKSDQPQLTTAQLAEILGIEENQLDIGDDGKVQLKTKIDGKEGTAKLAEALKTYQLQGHAENRARAVAEQEKALQSRMQQVEQAIKARVDQVEQLANVAGAELMREYQSIDWNSLRQVDPGQYAALQQDFANRKAQIQNVFQNVHQQRAAQVQQFEVQKAQYLAEEMQKLPTFIPEWKDEAVRAKESKELQEWALKKGFTQEQLRSLNESSALHVAIVRNAMMFDKLQTDKAAVENKVRQAPKIVKPGAPQGDAKETRLRDLQQTVKRTGGKGGSLEQLLIARGIA